MLCQLRGPGTVLGHATGSRRVSAHLLCPIHVSTGIEVTHLNAPSANASKWTCPRRQQASTVYKRSIARAANYDASYPASYPFHQNQYYRVTFVPPPYGPMKLYEDSSKAGTFNGVLVFKREEDLLSADDLSVLEVFVAGDTAFNTWSQLTHHTTDRPMVHDLMWSLLERARAGDSGRWSLLRVAIVELRDNVFIGRLFFGDPATGRVMWDCDCRPSDGCFLSIKSSCPFYVHRRVWDVAALPIRASSVYKLVAASTFRASASPPPPPGAPGAPPSPGASPTYSTFSSGTGAAPGSGSGPRTESEAAVRPGAPAPLPEDYLLLRPDDPPAIKLLKREMRVAISEEDYAACARLRDHAWMMQYRRMHDLRLAGRFDEAHRLELELRRQISAVTDTDL